MRHAFVMESDKVPSRNRDVYQGIQLNSIVHVGFVINPPGFHCACLARLSERAGEWAGAGARAIPQARGARARIPAALGPGLATGQLQGSWGPWILTQGSWCRVPWPRMRRPSCAQGPGPAGD